MTDAPSTGSSYGLISAVDVLDQLAAGEVVPRAALLRGALVLAFHTTDADETSVHVVADLERLVLGHLRLDKASRERAALVASALRRHIGVH